MTQVFRLSESAEYKRIKEIRDFVTKQTDLDMAPQIKSMANLAAGVIRSYCKPVPTASINKKNEEEADIVAKQNDIYDAVVSPETTEERIAAFCSSVLRNPSELSAAANLAFSELLFLIECEQPETKKFRLGGAANEDAKVKLARITRRKAEEALKSSLFDEAIKQLRDADEKYEFDFTVSYQLGLLYFFEKAHYEDAMTFFTKAYKAALNKSRPFMVASLAFMSLLQRLKYEATRENPLITEAYLAAQQAWNSDHESNFALYTLIQSSIHFNAEGDRKGEAIKLMKELFFRQKIYALQMICDPAFARFTGEVGGVCANIIEETNNTIADLFRGIEDNFEKLAGAIKFVSVPSKVAALRNGFNELSSKFTSKKMFDLLEVVGDTQTLHGSLAELYTEVNTNRMFYEVKSSIVSISDEYKREMEETGASFTRLEDELARTTAKLEQLNAKYPAGKVDASGDIVELAWFQHTGFMLYNFSIGFLTSCFLIGILVLAYIAFGLEFTWITYCLYGFIMLMLPLFSKICGEISYYSVENRRKGFQDEYKKLMNAIEAKRPMHDEDMKKVTHNYSALIAERHRIPFALSEKLLECAAGGNYDQIKSMLQSAAPKEKVPQMAAA